jgi:hypothetical protein
MCWLAFVYQLGVLGAEVPKVEHRDDPDLIADSGTDRALNRCGMGTSIDAGLERRVGLSP